MPSKKGKKCISKVRIICFPKLRNVIGLNKTHTHRRIDDACALWVKKTCSVDYQDCNNEPDVREKKFNLVCVDT